MPTTENQTRESESASAAITDSSAQEAPLGPGDAPTDEASAEPVCPEDMPTDEASAEPVCSEDTPTDEKPPTSAGAPEHMGQVMSRKKRWFWSLLFLLIAIASVWMVTSQSRDFTFGEFAAYLRNASPLLLFCALLCMMAFVFFEGEALRSICAAFGHRQPIRRGIVYSASDIYFSALTPSATGGQPASALFMVRDGIPGPIVTVALLTNLTMYTLSIIAIGLISFCIRPGLFLRFGTPSKILILFGCVAQISLALLFFMLLRQRRMLHRICDACLRLLGRMHLLRRPEKWRRKLEKSMEEYHHCAVMIADRRGMLVRVFLCNLLQRAALITVTMFAFLSMGGAPGLALDVWALQCYTVLGSNCIPIPGAMGVSDYLLLDGFGAIGMSGVEATNLELLSRALSFYCCTLLCGLITWVCYCLKRKGKKNQ